MPDREGDPSAGVPQTHWNGDPRSLPMVVVSPYAAEPSHTRGVTGLFVLAVIGLSAVAFLFLAYQNWISPTGYAQQLAAAEAVTRDADGMEAYVNALISQNEEMCRNAQAKPLAPAQPLLQEDIERRRAEYDRLCADNIRLRRENIACVKATPPLTSERSREQLCADYVGRR